MTPDREQFHRMEDEIDRLVQSAEDCGDADCYAGKRQNSRFKEGMQLEIKHCMDRAAPIWPATMHNVSDGGVSFWTRRELVIGDTIYLREFTPDNAAPWLAANVRHRTGSLKGYLIGTSFKIDQRFEPIKIKSF